VRILAEHIRYTAGTKFGTSREVFRDLSLLVESGECLGVIGREGSGKTTLLNLLGGLVPPSGGSLFLDGVNMGAAPDRAGGIRRRMGFTFQFPEEQFLSPTVDEEFRSLFRVRGIPEGERDGRRDAALRAAGLVEPGTGARSPFTLSLGESRRLALAFVSALRPAAAFLDEPTSGLDASGAACARSIVEGLLAGGCTVVIATHDLEFLSGVARSVLILTEGGIAARGEAAAILADRSLLAAHGYPRPPESLIR